MSEKTIVGLTWRVKELSGFDGLVLSSESVSHPLGDHDCLVKIEATSLNFRDLMIPKVKPASSAFELSATLLIASVGTISFPHAVRGGSRI